MVPTKAKDRLHAACDDCRNRKLKCSGDTPSCVRCKREGLECFYSPRKQMGRPRKRRRDRETDEPTEQLAVELTEQATNPNQFPVITPLSEFGLITPPDLHNLNYSNGSTAECTPSQHFHNLPDVFGVSAPSIIDFNLDPPIDPSLWDLQPDSQIDAVDDPSSNMGPCTCLSIVYLVLTELQSIETFSFPRVIIPLRKATSTLSDLIHCPQCPKEPFSAIQNTQSIVALFKAIVERFAKVLLEVDAEAARLQQSGQKKSYRIGDHSPALHHLHTGTLDCPMGFNVDLEARQWRGLVKTALRTEIYGGGSNPRPLTDLLKETEERQERWHTDRASWTEERRRMWYGGGHKCAGTKACEALGSDHIRRAMDHLNFK